MAGGAVSAIAALKGFWQAVVERSKRLEPAGTIFVAVVQTPLPVANDSDLPGDYIFYLFSLCFLPFLNPINTICFQWVPIIYFSREIRPHLLSEHSPARSQTSGIDSRYGNFNGSWGLDWFWAANSKSASSGMRLLSHDAYRLISVLDCLEISGPLQLLGFLLSVSWRLLSETPKMDLYLVSTNPENTMLLSANGVAHYQISTTCSILGSRITKILRPAVASDDSIVAEIEWKNRTTPTILRSPLLGGAGQCIGTPGTGVRALNYLYKRHRFSP